MTRENPWPGQVLRNATALNGYDSPEPDERAVTDITRATVVTSEIEHTEVCHKPVLDIDFPVKLVPSSTPGHFHLYLDRPMPWEQYERLLCALAEAGIIEQGYANASIERGYTAVRLPWIKKRNT